MSRYVLAAAAALFATTATAHEFEAEGLVIGHPFAFATTPTAMSGAGYLTVTNEGDTPDALIGIEADFPRVMLHTSSEEDGVMRMEHVERFEIAPGETLTLAPDGNHVMFMGLDGDPFEAGEEIPATLIFETAGRVDVVFNVEERGEMEMDHSEMDHSVMDHIEMDHD
ncbi:copper chaperone PCu(A)C [Pelagovum pacificum]|uniref:Copper chaperone PCu(A)C n=1 Tax=Pelagovum pacificum TaxID=2588711 RepID=A0A5C5G7Z4_9RHOB|nr:copper chaperone PCu(A)C [Pelagovum pacificum]QQA41604.1 copper chaperone PCu(A)C [Pelagovum pacificum]TNY30883.1 copper chaperone PCu(A)C [Pelagovum pacificum]